MRKGLTVAPLLLMMLTESSVRAQDLNAVRAKLRGNIFQFAALVVRSAQSFEALRDEGCPTAPGVNYSDQNIERELESTVPSSLASDFATTMQKERDTHRAEIQESARDTLKEVVQKGVNRTIACIDLMNTYEMTLQMTQTNFRLTTDALRPAEEAQDLNAVRIKMQDSLSALGGMALGSVQALEALRNDGCPAAADANFTEQDLLRELESIVSSSSPSSIFMSVFPRVMSKTADNFRTEVQKAIRDRVNALVQKGLKRNVACLFEVNVDRVKVRTARNGFKMIADALRLAYPP
jgi:hypothetical protein